jgi:hypothetical protein
MNSMLALARGRYVTWIADDDLYAPNFLEAVNRALNRFDFPLALYTSFMFGSGIPEEAIPRNECLFRGAEFLRRYFADEVKAIGTMGVFDREYMVKLGGLEDLTGEPMALYSEYLQIVKTGLLDDVAYVDAPLIVYRPHQGSWGCTTVDVELFKGAGENLSPKCIEILRRPELIQDFDQNLTRFLRRLMNEFINIAKENPSQAFDDWQLLKYLVYSRRYINSLKGSRLYWRAVRCLERIAAEIFWPVAKRWMLARAPAKWARRIAASASFRFRQMRSLTHR